MSRVIGRRGGGPPHENNGCLADLGGVSAEFILRWVAVTPVNMIRTNGCQIDVNAGRGEGLG